MSSSKDDGKTVKKLVVPSKFVNNISNFDSKDSCYDIEFVIPGRSKPLCLHMSHLKKTSVLLASVFKGQSSNTLCRFTKGSPSRLEWLHEKAATSETYREVLVKWLRFCYGEDQMFSSHECPAALAASFQLHLSCLDEIKTLIESYMTHVTKKDLKRGARMLTDCATVWDECHNERMSRIDRKLAKVLFTHDNMKKHPVTVVDRCLMSLPAEYLDMAEYSKTPDELDECHVRMKYVKCHKDKLNEKQQREIMKDSLQEQSPTCPEKGVGQTKEELKTAIMEEVSKTVNEEIKKALEQAKKERDDAMRTITEELERSKKEKEDMKKEIEESKRKIEELNKEFDRIRQEREEEKKLHGMFYD